MSVFITGASSGIGAACARAFAAAQYELILVARRSERLTTLSRELREEFGVRVHDFNWDVRDREALNQLFKKNADLFSKVDILINNAGLAKGFAHFQETDPEDWDDMIDTNVKGLLSITRAFLPQFIKEKAGHIVNIGSVAGHWVYEKGNVYCATKFAVSALTEGLRMDLHGTGIRVSQISPGRVETEFSEVRFKGDVEKAKAVYADCKSLTAADVAETVLWCIQRPPHVNVQEIILYPTDQASVHKARK
jgi:3-hydroxy acid dehydrogenase / malonic semialdehyde reductase